MVLSFVLSIVGISTLLAMIVIFFRTKISDHRLDVNVLLNRRKLDAGEEEKEEEEEKADEGRPVALPPDLTSLTPLSGLDEEEEEPEKEITPKPSGLRSTATSVQSIGARIRARRQVKKKNQAREGQVIMSEVD